MGKTGSVNADPVIDQRIARKCYGFLSSDADRRQISVSVDIGNRAEKLLSLP